MQYELDTQTCRDFAVSSRLEWMLPNGSGGFAMGTVSGANMRRYHGLLTASLRPPTDRMVLLSNVEAAITYHGITTGLSCNQYTGAVHPQGHLHLTQFRVGSHVEWLYQVGPALVLKRLAIHPGQNACTLQYTNLSEGPMHVSLRPLVCHKPHHENFRVEDFYPEFLLFPEGRTVLHHRGVVLSLEHPKAHRIPTTGWYYRFENLIERERGLDPIDDLFSPCELHDVLGPSESMTLVASTQEGTEAFEFPSWPEPGGIDEALQTAALKFLVQGEKRTTILAGYPWFNDWGRDTMISLPGVCLETGEVAAAKRILRDHAEALSQGMIPNRFVDEGREPDYNTVDATLWFANAIYLTLVKEWDEALAREAHGWLTGIVEWHEKGARYGIQVDQEDWLLKQGGQGLQLTWMDVKIGDWVVTPRHGKPVEVNGLWINLLRILEWLCDRLDEDGLRWRLAAEKAESHFEEKFWHPVVGHYLDTADPNDASLRPNQVIAMGLPFSPMEGPNALAALAKIEVNLLTPVGLRTLGPGEPDYHPRYEGSMAERDAAYHQGTVWPWLLGSYVAAVVRLTGDKAKAREAISGAVSLLTECGLGGISEVYDGNAPHRPGGCPWQAWSAAEILRAWRMTAVE